MKISNELIKSRKNPLVVWAAGLKEKKNREASGYFLAEGEKLLFEAISANLPIKNILIAESKKEQFLSRLSSIKNGKNLSDATVNVLDDGCFEKISTEKAPQGVITIVKHLDFFEKCTIIYNNDTVKDERILMLYSMQDPGNLGSCIRSAVAFGVDRIIMNVNSVDLYNPKTVRAAMGSLFRVKISLVDDLSENIKSFREGGRRVFAAELSENAVSLKEISAKQSDIFVIGNEGHGIPREVASVCDGSVYIPISKATESLNASVAAAIFMWETQKA